MTLNQLSRFYWARWSQTYYMDGALRNFDQGANELMWECLLNWVYYKDIADEIIDNTSDTAWEIAHKQTQGVIND